MIHTARTLQAAFGQLFPEEVDAIRELTNSLPPNATVLQVGAGSGTSSLSILEARGDVTLTTVDMRADDNPIGSLSTERKVVGEAGFAGRLTQIHGESIAVGRAWDGPLCDMVFLDGDHTYDGCIGDFHAWIPHVRPGGILAIHDYNKEDQLRNWDGASKLKIFNGVDRAVKEFLIGQYEQVLLVRTLIAFRMP